MTNLSHSDITAILKTARDLREKAHSLAEVDEAYELFDKYKQIRIKEDLIEAYQAVCEVIDEISNKKHLLMVSLDIRVWKNTIVISWDGCRLWSLDYDRPYEIDGDIKKKYRPIKEILYEGIYGRTKGLLMLLEQD